MSNIQDFVSYINNFSDVARADRFKVVLTPPPILRSLHPGATEALTFQCEMAELPGKTLALFETRTYGVNNKHPYQTQFADLNLEFICTSNLVGVDGKGLWEKRFFENWIEMINPTPDSRARAQYNIEYKDRYTTDIEIYHYGSAGKEEISQGRQLANDRDGNPQYEVKRAIKNPEPDYIVKYIGVFPYMIAPLNMNWQDESILKLQVTFAYSRWERLTAKFIQPDAASTPRAPAAPVTITTEPATFNNRYVTPISDGALYGAGE